MGYGKGRLKALLPVIQIRSSYHDLCISERPLRDSNTRHVSCSSSQDKGPMLALRDAILAATDISLEPEASQILSTWVESVPACSADSCSACFLSDNSCGVNTTRPDGNVTLTCNWMYIECSGGSVSSVSLSEFPYLCIFSPHLCIFQSWASLNVI